MVKETAVYSGDVLLVSVLLGRLVYGLSALSKLKMLSAFILALALSMCGNFLNAPVSGSADDDFPLSTWDSVGIYVLYSTNVSCCALG